MCISWRKNLSSVAIWPPTSVAWASFCIRKQKQCFLEIPFLSLAYGKQREIISLGEVKAAGIPIASMCMYDIQDAHKRHFLSLTSHKTVLEGTLCNSWRKRLSCAALCPSAGIAGAAFCMGAGTFCTRLESLFIFPGLASAVPAPRSLRDVISILKVATECSS